MWELCFHIWQLTRGFFSVELFNRASLALLLRYHCHLLSQWAVGNGWWAGNCASSWALNWALHNVQATRLCTMCKQLDIAQCASNWALHNVQATPSNENAFRPNLSSVNAMFVPSCHLYFAIIQFDILIEHPKLTVSFSPP